MFIGQEFLNIGWRLKGGLPYTPWAAQVLKERMAANGEGDPSAHCVPVGLVKLHMTPLLRKIVQTPGLMLILSEFDGSGRQIFTDGRPLPEDMFPTYNGYSTGKWEGDVLVVHTEGLHDGMWLDRSGSPSTDAAKITERFHRVNYGKLEIDLTVEDSKAYTKPWTIRLNQFIALDTDLAWITFAPRNEKIVLQDALLQ